MTSTLRVLTTCLFLLPITGLPAAIIWDGPMIIFSKAAGDDHTLPQHQDTITPSVTITRGSGQGLFNTARESSYSPTSPAGTEWSYGSTSDIDSLTFTTWFQWHGQNPPSSVNQPAVLHLTEADIYLDITILSWGQGVGSFSYTRSTPTPIPEPAQAGALGALIVAACTVRVRRRRGPEPVRKEP